MVRSSSRILWIGLVFAALIVPGAIAAGGDGATISVSAKKTAKKALKKSNKAIKQAKKAKKKANNANSTADEALETAKNAKGETGPQGPQGETGPQGPQGVPGADGAPGLNAYSGGGTISNGFIRYQNPIGIQSQQVGPATAGVLSPNRQISISEMYFELDTVVDGAGSFDVTFFVENVATAATCSISGASTSCSYDVPLVVPPRSKMSIEFDNGSTVNETVYWSMTVN